MGTNRTRRARRWEPIAPNSFIEFLRTGQKPVTDLEFWIDAQYFSSSLDTETIWKELRSEILREWIKAKPCTRPWAWWVYDTPEKRREGEPEAALLERHALLRAAEVQWLEQHPEALKPKKIGFDQQGR